MDKVARVLELSKIIDDATDELAELVGQDPKIQKRRGRPRKEDTEQPTLPITPPAPPPPAAPPPRPQTNSSM